MTNIQIKPIAIELFAARLPDFTAYPKKGGYWFRRKSHGITDIVVCTASLKYGTIEIDIYCGVFDDWAGNYGTHLAWSGKRLDNLRWGSNALDVELIGYRHQQTTESVVSALQAAISDVEYHALPFFAEFRNRFEHHPLTSAALKWIRERRATIPVSVGPDIQSDLTSNGLYHMTNAYFLELQAHLRKVEGTSREDNKGISILVLDLFRCFSEANGNI
jgi:hypothetical protein